MGHAKSHSPVSRIGEGGACWVGRMGAAAICSIRPLSSSTPGYSILNFDSGKSKNSFFNRKKSPGRSNFYRKRVATKVMELKSTAPVTIKRSSSYSSWWTEQRILWDQSGPNWSESMYSMPHREGRHKKNRQQTSYFVFNSILMRIQCNFTIRV